MNFLGDEGPDQIRAAYPGTTWDRLAAVKAAYDPANLFGLNQNVPPAEGTVDGLGAFSADGGQEGGTELDAVAVDGMGARCPFDGISGSGSAMDSESPHVHELEGDGDASAWEGQESR